MVQRIPPLIASENITSPAVRQLWPPTLATDMRRQGRPRYYQGVKYIDQVEQDAIDLALKLFKAEHVTSNLLWRNANMPHFCPFTPK